MLLFFKIMMTEFIAEMGDKTQLMLIAMTSKFKMRHIIIGTALAVVVLNALAVIAGGLVGSLIPQWLLKIIAALAFLFFAATSIGGDDEDEEEVKEHKIKLSFIAVFVTFFIAELGDKTQLTAITFGANEGLENAFIVWAACSVGLFAADIIGMLIGYYLKSRIPEGALKALAFVIFAIFGIITMNTGLSLLLGEGSSLILPLMIGITSGFIGLCIGLHIKSAKPGQKLLNFKSAKPGKNDHNFSHNKANKNTSILINGKLYDNSDYNPERDASENYIYEVIRIINGRPLFAKEHYNRLTKSLAAIGHETNFTFDEMINNINKLAKVSGKSNDNIQIIVDNFQKDSQTAPYNVYMILLDATYPSSTDYAKGVRTQLFQGVRLNPHIKVRNQTLRDNANKLIEENNLFEVILVDNNGCITEGSRSNIFFIKDDTVYTSPEGDVLMGVTRQAIIRICQANNIKFTEQNIPADSIDIFDAAFISGTSPKVLPISSIDDIDMNVKNKTLRQLMALFDKECGLIS